jgi:predicted thioesterase
MKTDFSVGAALTAKVTIDRERTIAFMGDELRVYATPSMVLDVEQTCRQLLLAWHDEGEDSVGAHVHIDHLGPTLLGQVVTVSARVAELDLPRVVFEVEVRDELDTVGRARHVRFVIDRTKQAERLRRKAARLAATRSGA